MFKDHHYLDGNINKAARCYVGVWNDEIVAFGASITLPSGTLKNAWRGRRTVILPDFQGMGIGVRFIEAVAQLHLEEGHRFFSRSAHPRMHLYMEASPLWKATSKNKKLRTDVTHDKVYKNHFVDNKRICYSYEYIGETKKSNPLLRWNEHKSKIEKGIGCPALQNAVKKHGIENFKFEIICICFDEDCNKYEKEYIFSIIN